MGSRLPLTNGQVMRLRARRAARELAGWHTPPCVFGLTIGGHLDHQLLSAALTAVASRHTALRCYFPRYLSGVDEGECVAAAAATWPLEVVDLRALPPELTQPRRRAAITGLYDPCRLDSYPLCRAVLILESDESVLGVSVDHVIFDGASVGVFFADLQAAVACLSRGAPTSELTGHSSDFSSFARYERQWLGGPQASDALTYWAPRWSASGPFPELPGALRAAAQPGPGAGVAVTRVLDKSAFDEFSRRASLGYMSEFVIFAATLLLAMREVGGVADVGLLYTVSRRNWAWAASGIGLFANRVLLHAPASQGRSITEMAAFAREEVIGALEHGMMPFGVLADRLCPGQLDRTTRVPYLTVNLDPPVVVPALAGLHCTFNDLEVSDVFGVHPGLNFTMTARPDGLIQVLCGFDASLCAECQVTELMDAALGTIGI